MPVDLRDWYQRAEEQDQLQQHEQPLVTPSPQAHHRYPLQRRNAYGDLNTGEWSLPDNLGSLGPAALPRTAPWSPMARAPFLADPPDFAGAARRSIGLLRPLPQSPQPLPNSTVAVPQTPGSPTPTAFHPLARALFRNERERDAFFAPGPARNWQRARSPTPAPGRPLERGDESPLRRVRPRQDQDTYPPPPLVNRRASPVLGRRGNRDRENEDSSTQSRRPRHDSPETWDFRSMGKGGRRSGYAMEGSGLQV
ncbi:hypothetical protein JCM8097_001446 [Rhodosporidiobolus ruineniae]